MLNPNRFSKSLLLLQGYACQITSCCVLSSLRIEHR
jgi:hypothetical protein